MRRLRLPKPVNYHPFEFCENGAKVTISDLTSARCKPSFWDGHTVSELRNWNDYDLEQPRGLPSPCVTTLPPIDMSR